MYYKQALKPNELLPALSDSGECFFIIRAALPIRNYQVAIYRYDDEYFYCKMNVYLIRSLVFPGNGKEMKNRFCHSLKKH